MGTIVAKPLQPRIKLFQLPYLIIKETVSHMKVSEVISLSMCSKKAKRNVGQLCLPSQIMMKIYIKDRFIIDLIAPGKQRVCASFWIEHGEDDTPIETSYYASRYIPGNSEMRRFFFHPSNQVDSKMQLLILHTLQVYSECRIKDVYIDFNMKRRPPNFHADIALAAVRSTERLSVFGEGLGIDFQNLLESTEVTKRFQCWDPFPMDYYIRDSLNCAEQILIENASWLDLESLYSKNCRVIELVANRLTTEDVIVFLNRWRESVGEDMKNITCFQIRHSAEWGQIDVHRLEPRPWIGAVRPRYFQCTLPTHTDDYYNSFDCLQAIDIRRHSDGLLGTVIQKKKLFRFVVWHHLNQQVPQ